MCAAWQVAVPSDHLRRSLRVAWVCLAAVLVLVGCKDERAETLPEANEPALVDPTHEAYVDPRSTLAETASPVEPKGSDEVELVGGPVPAREPEAAPAADSGRTPSEEATPRDLGAELKETVGIPRDCVADWQPASARIIRVTVTATVRPSGDVMMASVAGTGLSQQSRQCIARHVETAVLNPLQDAVSQRVSTVIEIDWVPPPPPTVQSAKAGAPDPVLRNVREPLPKRSEVAPSGRPIQEPTSRPIQEPSSRPIQDPSSRPIRGPQPRSIDGWEVDESSKEWR